MDENSKSKVLRRETTGPENRGYLDNATNPNKSERLKRFKKQISMPERVQNHTKYPEIEASRLNNWDSANSQCTQNPLTESSVRRTKKYTGSRLLNRQKSMPEFDVSSTKSAELSTLEDDHPNLQTYIRSKMSNKIESLERQNTMPEFTIQKQSTYCSLPKTDKNFLNKNLQSSSNMITKVSDQITRFPIKDQKNLDKNHTVSQNIVNPPRKVQLTRQKTMPEYRGTSSAHISNAPSTIQKKFNFGNEPTENCKISSREQKSNFVRRRHEHQNSFSDEPKSLLNPNTNNSFDKNIGTTPISQNGSPLFSSASKSLTRQNSMPETSVPPKANLDHTEMSINNDIQNRKLRYENDSLDLNKQMRRQKAELRANGPGKSNWKPQIDTKTYTPNPEKSYSPHLQPTRRCQPSTSTESRTQTTPRTNNNQPRQLNCNRESTANVSREHTSSFDRSTRTPLRRNVPGRKFSIDSSIGNNPAGGSATTPARSNKWQDEARNQVWRGYMQRVKNLDRF